ncbi:MAG: hypothetical protein ABIG37_02200 [Nanoarchaeota archaeon]|nr:hypothetical protein [Nanoarchaeota archaeon]
MINGIIYKNLERMESPEKGGMDELLLTESIGGNAGTFNGMSCAGANFCYDPFSGEIVYFANFQNIPLSIMEKVKSKELKEGFFRAALDTCEFNFRIIEIFAEPETETAKRNLEASVLEYNQRHSNS